MDPAPAVPLDESLLDRLRDHLDDAGLVTDPERLAAYETDELDLFHGRPAAALRPASREALVAVVRTLAEAGVAFVPRGAGSGLAGAAVPTEGLIVSTERLDRLLELDPVERTATVEPGVITESISEAAEPHGLEYLPDPASQGFCSIGGNVAMNAGGPHCLKHGVTTDHVLELEIVTPEGQVLTLDRGESGGLDLAGAFIGSEGTLGIATRIVVRLVPRTPAVRTVLALYDDLADAGAAVSAILGTGVVPVAMEIIDRATLEAVEASPHAAGLPTDVAAALLVECQGLEEEVDEELFAVAGALEGTGAREILAATDEGQRTRLWKARRQAYHALEPLARNVVIQDAVVPRTALPELLPRIQEVASEHGLRVVNFFHAGDGNLHPNIPFDGADPDEVERVHAATEEIMRMCVDAGGTITGEHGVGLDKKKHMRLIFSDAELELQRALEGALDPVGLANPGKMLP